MGECGRWGGPHMGARARALGREAGGGTATGRETSAPRGERERRGKGRFASGERVLGGASRRTFASILQRTR